MVTSASCLPVIQYGYSYYYFLACCSFLSFGVVTNRGLCDASQGGGLVQLLHSADASSTPPLDDPVNETEIVDRPL